MGRIVFKNKGITLIELLIALVIGSILLGALYQTFIRQQKTYAIQDQVVDMQQNVRMGIDRMSRELRMAGYGGKILTVFLNDVNGFSTIITPADNANNIGNNDDKITIILADQVGVLTSNALKGSTTLDVSGADELFNTVKKKYLNLNGQNNYVVSSVSTSTITLATALAEDHLANEPVNLVKAITYDLGISDGKQVLRRNENTGGGAQPLAENIENLQFRYFDANEVLTTTPANILRIEVKVTARTSMSDPEYGSGGGYRTRVLTSSIKVRNMGL
jgi:prepilin-type N-terminal cleavage/methylation domain-containing protein